MNIRKPKIVFLTTSLNGGGAERSLLEVFTVIDRQRFDPTLWRLDSSNMYPEYLSESDSTEVLPPLSPGLQTAARTESVHAKLPPYLRKVCTHELIEDGLRLFDRLRRLIEETFCPVVLASSQLSMNIRAAVLQWLCNYQYPVVFIEQNEPCLRYVIGEDSGTRVIAWARIQEMYPRATHIVAVSRAVKKSLVSKFKIDKNRISVIPNPVNIPQIRAYLNHPAPAHPFYQEQAPILLCTARFHYQKNHFLLLRSLAIVRKKILLKLILLGHGVLKDPIQRAIMEMGLDKDVAIVDFNPRPFSFAAHADLSVLASYFEGCSSSLTESLACGIPVVSTNWSGSDEIIEDGVNGIICDMNDVAFANGIVAGLKLAKAKAVHASAAKSAKKFNATVIGRKYERLFGRLIYKRAPKM